MRIMKLRSWTMLSLVAPVLLLAACGDSGSTDPTPVPTPTPISLTGAWSMDETGSTPFVYTFTLTINQTGAAIAGVMDSLNTSEANTPIDGAFDGTTITFVRHGATYTQVYTGAVSSGGHKLSGTFSHNNSASIYLWSATR
jgi:hypothetical protein